MIYAILLFFLKIFLVFINLYTQHGVETHNPEIESCLLFRLSQSGALDVPYFYEHHYMCLLMNYVCISVDIYLGMKLLAYFIL